MQQAQEGTEHGYWLANDCSKGLKSSLCAGNMLQYTVNIALTEGKECICALPQGQIPEPLGVPSEPLAWGPPVGPPTLQPHGI